MTTYADFAYFTPSGGGSPAYRLDVDVVTTAVSGGTQVYVTASATQIRFSGIIPAFSSNGSRTYNVPGGRTLSVNGSLLESGSASWSYDFGSNSTQTVWGGFSRYIPSGYGSSTSVTITATGSQSNFLTTASVTINNIALFQNVTVPNLNNLSRTSANTTLSNAGLNASSSVVSNTIGSYLNDQVVSNSQNPAAGSTVASGSTVSFNYYGTYVAPQYTVTFNANGGSVSPTSTTVTSPNSITLPTPFRTGYNFNGWYTSSSGGSYIGGAGSSYTPTSSITLYAQWSAIQYTISFQENGGTNVSDITANVNSTVQLPTNTTRAGYTFSGWFSNSSLTVGPYTTWTVTANQTLYAKWTAIAPGFTDETVSSSLILNQDISDTADNSVSATNATSYAIAYAGSNLNPTSWLTIDNSGNLSGSTNQVGVYSFVINATGTGGTTPSNIKTITVYYPGKRINNSLGETAFTNAKRRDQFGNWVNITSMKRYDGTNWVDITN